jgi:hypothetical protein
MADGAGHERARLGKRLYGFGFRGSGAGHDQDPKSIAGELFCRSCGEHGIERRSVVIFAEPALERRVDTFRLRFATAGATAGCLSLSKSASSSFRLAFRTMRGMSS